MNYRDINGKVKPRVLILAHNPLSLDQNNGKTIASLLQEIPKADIAQVYLSTDIPEFSLCSNYFQLNDFDVLKKIIRRKEYGHEIKIENRKNQIENKNRIRKSVVLKIFRRVKGPLFSLLRDGMWLFSGFRESALIAFIDKFKPNILFFQSSGNVFSFKIAQWIARKYQLKTIIQTTDDYLGYGVSLNPFAYVLRKRLNNIYMQMVANSSLIIAIGDDLANEYSKKFGGKYYVAANAVNIGRSEIKKDQQGVVKLLFSGNIGLNRWKTLLLLSEAIKKLNKKTDIRFKLEIYTLSEVDSNVLRRFRKYEGTKFMGMVSAKKLKSIRNDADILVHVESFDFVNRYVTRLSISTKISEYLASERAMLSIGPANISSIRYLKRHHVAEVVTVPKECEVEKALIRLSNKEYREIIAQNAYTLACARHNKVTIAAEIKTMLETILVE